MDYLVEKFNLTPLFPSGQSVEYFTFKDEPPIIWVAYKNKNKYLILKINSINKRILKKTPIARNEYLILTKSKIAREKLEEFKERKLEGKKKKQSIKNLKKEEKIKGKVTKRQEKEEKIVEEKRKFLEEEKKHREEELEHVENLRAQEKEHTKKMRRIEKQKEKNIKEKKKKIDLKEEKRVKEEKRRLEKLSQKSGRENAYQSTASILGFDSALLSDSISTEELKELFGGYWLENFD